MPDVPGDCRLPGSGARTAGEARSCTRLARYHGYMRPMTIRFPDELHEHLRRAAFERHVSMNDLVCEGVEMRLAVESKNAVERREAALPAGKDGE